MKEIMENRKAIEYLMDVRNGIHIPSPGRELPLCNKQEKEAIDMAISALKKQEVDRWIPVTERLPEEDGRYLITEKTDGTKVQEGYFCRTRDGEPYWGYLHIIAWRPLPEPYKEEKK